MTWKEIKVADLGKIITGNTPPKARPEFYGTEYKFIKATDMEVGSRFTSATEECYSQLAFEKYRSSLIPPLSTCVVTIGTLGKKITLTEEYCFVNQAINAVIPNTDEYDPYFVFYSLKNILQKVKAADTGASSGRENVSKSNFSNLTLSVPTDITAQKKIGAALSAYDDLIENNIRRIQLLEEAAQNIYKEWFVHFRFPGNEKAKWVNGLPKGWKKEKVGNVVNITKGKKPINELEKPTKESQLYLLVDVLEGKMFRYTEDERLPECKAGETLMLMDGSRSGCVFRGLEGAIGSTLGLFKAKLNLFSDFYCYQYLKSREGEIRTKNTGAAIPHANKGYIAMMDILIPNEDILKLFDEKLLPIISLIQNLKYQNTHLKEARDILLPLLMNGTVKASYRCLPLEL